MWKIRLAVTSLNQVGPGFTQVVATSPYDSRPCPHSPAFVGGLARSSISFVEEDPSHLDVSQDADAFDSGSEATAISFPDDPSMYVVIAQVHEFVGTYLFEGEALQDRTADLLKIVTAGSLRMSHS